MAKIAVGDDLHWVLDDARRDVLLRLTPEAFEGDRATWGLVLAQAWALRGNQAKVREYAEDQVVRIHILLGNYERALDLLEPLLKAP